MASVQPVPKLLGIVDDDASEESPFPSPLGRGLGGTLIGAVGIAFLAVGFADLLLAWLPLSFGQPEWEFGTVTATLDGLPIFVIGLALVVADASRRGASRSLRFAAVTCLVLALSLTAMVALYATVVPLALQSVPEGGVRVGLLKAVGKTTIQALVYPVLLAWMGVLAWRHASRT